MLIWLKEIVNWRTQRNNKYKQWKTGSFTFLVFSKMTVPNNKFFEITKNSYSTIWMPSGLFPFGIKCVPVSKTFKKWQHFEPFDSKYYMFFFYLLVSNMWILKVLLKKSKFWMIEWRYSTNSWLTERDTLMKLKWSEFSLVKIEKKKSISEQKFYKICELQKKCKHSKKC